MLINENNLIIKKSKFIGYLYEITSEEMASNILSEIRNNHRKATHVVYAYILNNTAKKSDDGEPSGTAATPIYNLLEKKQQVNKMIVVVRYFGGTKLGAGLLFRTYLKTASELL